MIITDALTCTNIRTFTVAGQEGANFIHLGGLTSRTEVRAMFLLNLVFLLM